jgi:hypothetical protein
MKKLYAASFALLLFAACQKADVRKETVPENEITESSEKRCASHEVLEEQMAADPTLRQRMNELESFTQTAIQQGRLVNGQIEIPVVVHVIYRTASENISDAQVQSQIDVLNEDFGNTNADKTKVPVHFQDEQTTVGIKFVLDRIIRKYSNKRSWSTNDDMKRSSRGGSDPINPSYYLNIWSVNKMTSWGQTILGYAQFPGGNPATDGVVLGYNFFGRTGTLSAPYHKGRTATHEVGHWLNLRHIWGDATCGNDFVGDTPLHNTSNGGCPTATHRSTCTGTPLEMWMNYMDYTYDECMYMFTNGQRDRMLAVFAAGGPRASMAQ